METKLIARSRKIIHASISKVWEALVDPEKIKQYMFGTDVISDWKEGRSIVWKGEWKGKKYEDKGTILKLEKLKTLQYSHYSPLSGKPDIPANYHIVTITLSEFELHIGVEVELTQDNNDNEDEQKHSESNWDRMLDGLKKFLEG
jgi:uncharacterized protein YndB with AHSA1/START domain